MSDLKTDAERILHLINICGITDRVRFYETLNEVTKLWEERK